MTKTLNLFPYILIQYYVSVNHFIDYFACINALHLAFILKIHTQMNVEKRQYLILSPMFPLAIIYLGTFDPMEKISNIQNY